MKRLTSFTETDCLRWLLKHDSEERWYWIKCFMFSRNSLYDAVLDNLADFGYTSTGKVIEVLHKY